MGELKERIKKVDIGRGLDNIPAIEPFDKPQHTGQINAWLPGNHAVNQQTGQPQCTSFSQVFKKNPFINRLSSQPDLFSTAAHVANAVGTTIKFDPVLGTDKTTQNGCYQTITTRHQCITGMKEYENKSLEELRYEDYKKKAPYWL